MEAWQAEKLKKLQAFQPPSLKPLTMNYELSALSYLTDT
jgi:hypothetical protein